MATGEARGDGVSTQRPLPFMPAIAMCNRCNAVKEGNGPCPKCGCPEFRLVR